MAISRQQVLDRIIKGVEDNELPGYDPVTNTCAYRTRNGKKCVFGLFIPDGHKACNYFGSSSVVLLDNADLRSDLAAEVTADDWRDLQRFHDAMAKEWNGELFIEQCRAILEPK